ncbi:MAG: 30S ribosomal protein S12 methylthiotransferase RimO [Eubacteriales bacterium]|nr:30S ribosomal protein S12 methylthiotransferase RimO [Eubacteriales bacterium]
MKVAMKSLGCPKNEVDAEVLLYELEKAGYAVTDHEEQADIIIVNTCGFIGDAAQESVNTILDMAEYKKDRCRLLIVSGCLSQRYQQDLFEQLPEVDLMLGVAQYPQIVSYVEQTLQSKGRLLDCALADVPSVTSGRRLERGHFAYLKIAEGCDNFCTYCTIPRIRGHYHSRAREDIVAEARMLADRGVAEVTLIAQDTTRYGTDRYGKPELASLMREVAHVPGIRWVRVLYCYPELVTPELLETIAGEENICNYIDIPLQHIDDNILRRMGRRSTEAQIRELIPRIRDEYGIAVRTTFIVGFPGESREASRKLLEFVKEARFAQMGAFRYSPEEDTPAAAMPDQVSERTKQARYDRLMLAQQAISLENMRVYAGKTLPVIVDKKTGKNTWQARTAFQSPDIDGCVILKGEALHPGQFVDAAITGCDPYDLQGEVL